MAEGPVPFPQSFPDDSLSKESNRCNDKNYQLGKNLNDQKNTDFQNVLEIDHKGIKFTLKESQVSVKQIIEIQGQETVRMFFFKN